MFAYPFLVGFIMHLYFYSYFFLLLDVYGNKYLDIFASDFLSWKFYGSASTLFFIYLYLPRILFCPGFKVFFLDFPLPFFSALEFSYWKY